MTESRCQKSFTLTSFLSAEFDEHLRDAPGGTDLLAGHPKDVGMATGLTANTSADRIFESPAFVFNEVYEPAGMPRQHWQKFLNGLRNVTVDEFARRNQQADRMLRENGVTYHLATEGGDGARPWRLDLLPMLTTAADWAVLESALAQRATVLNLLIADIYGPRQLISEGILPPAVLYANPEFLRPFCDLRPGDRQPLFLYAAELARSANGQWWVMADRSEAPAGPGFALENRIVSSRCMPSAFKQIQVERLAPFFGRLQNSIRRRSPRPTDSPRIVLLSSGPAHPYYFEDVYLARYLGYTMVEGGDLAVRNDAVFMKTLSGLVPVDIILSRGAESGLDPLELGGYAAHGVPGLLNAIRSGNVSTANIPGCGIVGAPVFMAFLPALCQRLLGEPMKLPSITTWWLGDEDSKSEVLSRIDDLVLKPAFQKSGNEEIIVSDLSAEQRRKSLERVLAEPYSWVAQEKIARSSVPVWTDSGIRCGHAAVRAFLVEDESRWHMMPGGLIRIAPDSGPMQLSVSAGDGSK
ncbi:MAG: circularly permuted type 2 ATP-grasp protein, partial [Planctomycetota bacterium]